MSSAGSHPPNRSKQRPHRWRRWLLWAATFVRGESTSATRRFVKKLCYVNLCTDAAAQHLEYTRAFERAFGAELWRCLQDANSYVVARDDPAKLRDLFVFFRADAGESCGKVYPGNDPELVPWQDFVQNPTLRSLPGVVFLENDEIWGAQPKNRLEAERYAELALYDLWTHTGVDTRSDEEVALDFLTLIFNANAPLTPSAWRAPLADAISRGARNATGEGTLVALQQQILEEAFLDHPWLNEQFAARRCVPLHEVVLSNRTSDETLTAELLDIVGEVVQKLHSKQPWVAPLLRFPTAHRAEEFQSGLLPIVWRDQVIALKNDYADAHPKRATLRDFALQYLLEVRLNQRVVDEVEYRPDWIACYFEALEAAMETRKVQPLFSRDTFSGVYPQNVLARAFFVSKYFSLLPGWQGYMHMRAAWKDQRKKFLDGRALEKLLRAGGDAQEVPAGEGAAAADDVVGEQQAAGTLLCGEGGGEGSDKNTTHSCAGLRAVRSEADGKRLLAEDRKHMKQPLQQVDGTVSGSGVPVWRALTNFVFGGEGAGNEKQNSGRTCPTRITSTPIEANMSPALRAACPSPEALHARRLPLLSDEQWGNAETARLTPEWHFKLGGSETISMINMAEALLADLTRGCQRNAMVPDVWLRRMAVGRDRLFLYRCRPQTDESCLWRVHATADMNAIYASWNLVFCQGACDLVGAFLLFPSISVREPELFYPSRVISLGLAMYRIHMRKSVTAENRRENRRKNGAGAEFVSGDANKVFFHCRLHGRCPRPESVGENELYHGWMAFWEIHNARMAREWARRGGVMGGAAAAAAAGLGGYSSFGSFLSSWFGGFGHGSDGVEQEHQDYDRGDRTTTPRRNVEQRNHDDAANTRVRIVEDGPQLNARSVWELFSKMPFAEEIWANSTRMQEEGILNTVWQLIGRMSNSLSNPLDVKAEIARQYGLEVLPELRVARGTSEGGGHTETEFTMEEG